MFDKMIEWPVVYGPYAELASFTGMGFHIPAQGGQIVNFTENGIINNLSDPASASRTTAMWECPSIPA